MDPTEEIETPEEEETHEGETLEVETPEVETPAEGETPEGGEPAKVEPTVESSIEDALKALEPKTDEQKAAEKAAAAEAAKTPEQKAADKTAADKAAADAAEAAKKAPDHINDPIDPRLRETTKARIESLIATAKEQAAVVENQGAIIAAIQDTGATPEDFTAMITYMKLVNSDQPTDLEKAYAMLQGGLRTISLKLGRALPEVDVLNGHKDLLDAIASGQITQAHAEEIAIARARNNAANTGTAALRTQQQQQVTENLARDAAITELNTLGDHLKKTDADYNAKYAAIIEPLKASFAHMHPSKWKATFTAAYNAVKIAKPATSTATAGGQPAKPKAQPLRPSAPAGGGKREPANVAEAMFGEGFPE